MLYSRSKHAREYSVSFPAGEILPALLHSYSARSDEAAVRDFAADVGETAWPPAFRRLPTSGLD
jgi:hypothetical protein